MVNVPWGDGGQEVSHPSQPTFWSSWEVSGAALQGDDRPCSSSVPMMSDMEVTCGPSGLEGRLPSWTGLGPGATPCNAPAYHLGQKHGPLLGHLER